MRNSLVLTRNQYETIYAVDTISPQTINNGAGIIDCFIHVIYWRTVSSDVECFSTAGNRYLSFLIWITDGVVGFFMQLAGSHIVYAVCASIAIISLRLHFQQDVRNVFDGSVLTG